MVVALFYTKQRYAPLGHTFPENTKYGLSHVSVSLHKFSLFQSFSMLQKKLNNLSPFTDTAEIN